MGSLRLGSTMGCVWVWTVKGSSLRYLLQIGDACYEPEEVELLVPIKHYVLATSHTREVSLPEAPFPEFCQCTVKMNNGPFFSQGRCQVPDAINHAESGDSAFMFLAESNHLWSFHEWIIWMFPLYLTNKWADYPHPTLEVKFICLFSL